MEELLKFCSLFPKLNTLNIELFWENTKFNVSELIETMKKFFAKNLFKFIINFKIENINDFIYCHKTITQHKCYTYKKNNKECVNIKVKLADKVFLDMYGRLYKIDAEEYSIFDSFSDID